MAVRYCGQARIGIVYRDTGDYRAVVSSPAGRTVVYVGPPAAGFGAGIAYDSPLAYDQSAHAAVTFATDAEPGHSAHVDITPDGAGWAIRRWRNGAR